MSRTETTSQLPCASTHTHVWTQWDAYTHAHKASVATETWFSRVSKPSQQSTVLTNRALCSLYQENQNTGGKHNWFWKQTYLSFLSRHLTKMGRIPDFIKSSIGGFLSLESSFLEEIFFLIIRIFTKKKKNSWWLNACVLLFPHLAACTALSWITALSLVAFCNEKRQWS